MTLQQQIRANRIRTVVLLLMFGVLIALVSLAADVQFGPQIIPLIFAGGILYGIFSWFNSWRMVGALTRAKTVDRAAAPALYNIVDTLAIAAGLAKTPEVRIVDDPAPNAFASGRDPDHSFIAVTTGLLDIMDKRELEGVLAHELSHVRNRDIRLMTLAVVLVGVIALLSDLILRATLFGGRRRDNNPWLMVIALVALVLAPLSAIGIQLAISRKREYLADASGVEMTNDPEGLALALKKLLYDKQVIRDTSRSTAHLYIESPLHKATGILGTFKGMFETHPPLESRIARLEEAGGFTIDLTAPSSTPVAADSASAGLASANPVLAVPYGMPGVAGAFAVPHNQPATANIFCTHCGHALDAHGICTNCGKPSEILHPVAPPSDDDDLRPPSFAGLHDE
jgi:heat shock protein HtpX